MQDSPGPTKNPYLIHVDTGKGSGGGDNDSYVSDLTGITGDVPHNPSPSRVAAAAIQAKSLLIGQGATTPSIATSSSYDEGDSTVSDHRDLLTAHEHLVSTPTRSSRGSTPKGKGKALSYSPRSQESGDSVSYQDARERFDNESHKIIFPTSSFEMPVIEEDADEKSRPSSMRTTIDFLNDDVHEMTWGRRIALYLMERSSLYNPRLKKEVENEEDDEKNPLGASSANTENPGLKEMTQSSAMENYPYSCSKRETPSLAKAWAFFEHVTLPRYIAEPKTSKKKNICVRMLRKFLKGQKELKRAEPGENGLPTKLYQPVWTPHKQLGDFGLGVGLYFSTLRGIFLLTLLAGLLNVPNLIYFSSPEYSEGQKDITNVLLRGSAICTQETWVPCPNCTSDKFPPSRLKVTYDVLGRNLTFALKNDCDGATFQQGMINFGSLLLFIVGIFLLNLYLKRMEVAFDEDEQTAQDYSILINNPPGDATYPQEWKDFFFDNFDGAHATTVTIAVDNDHLVRYLVSRREMLRKIEMLIEPGTRMDVLTLARLAAKEERERSIWKFLLAKVSPGLPEIFAKVVVLTAQIQGMAQQSYPATNVFVTFETEDAQRRVLQALSLGYLDISRNNKKALVNPNHAFRGSVVLSVTEPDEPNTIRWQDLNSRWKERYKQQALTLTATAVAIIAIALIVRVLNKKKALWTAIAIAIFNSLFPMFAKFLNSFESHAAEGHRQRSLYCKIAFFRWVNTAIVITIITPFEDTLVYDKGLITKIYALFFAEIVTTNLIQLADPVSHLQKHILAPRSATQDDMNIKFRGTPLELAERYTNMTKLLFLCVWYCAIFPNAFFLCAFSLFITYFVDRFSLMRTWSRQPHLGKDISEVSRMYFFSLAIVAMAIVSSYYWSGFPYDNLCETQTTGGLKYAGRVYTNSSDAFSQYLSPSEPLYEYCSQDFFRQEVQPSFPFVPANQEPGKEWMTPDQERLCNIYGYAAVAVFVFVILSFLWSIFQSIWNLFSSSYNPCGQDQGINFSEVPSISSYIPQVESQLFSYPLLACNIDDIDTDLLEWTDPDRPHSFYDLTKDADFLLRGTDASALQVFSQIYHYPPLTNSVARKRGQAIS